MNSISQFPWWFAPIPAAILVLLAGLSLFGPRDGIGGIHERVFALYQSLEPWRADPSRKAGGRDVILIDIDAQTMARWDTPAGPRLQLASLVERAGNAGAAAIIIGTVPRGADPYSLKEIAARLPLGPERDAVIAGSAETPDSDDLLEEAIRRHSVVVTLSLASRETPRLPEPLGTIAYAGDDPHGLIPSAPAGRAPLARFTGAAKGLGYTHAPSMDGNALYLPLFIRVNDVPYPAALLEALRLVQGAGSYLVTAHPPAARYDLTSQSGIKSVRSGIYSIPTRFDGTYRLHRPEGPAVPKIPAWQVLEGDADLGGLRDAIVFIGASGTGEPDSTIVQAQALKQILSGHHLIRPSWAEMAETLSIVFVGALIILLLKYIFPGPVYGVAGTVIAAQIVGGWAVFSAYGLLLDPITPAAAILVVLVSADVVHRALSRSNAQFLRQAFQGALSEDALETLALRSNELKFDGRIRQVTSLIGDLRGFSEITPTYEGDPRGLARLINRLHTVLSREVVDRRGFVDNIIADGLVALWNAPLEDGQHTVHACGCALRMIEALDGLNSRLEQEARRQHRPHVSLILGIGIDTGDALVGDLGSDHRFHYTAIGQPVSVASALEQQSKFYGPAILVSQRIRDRVGERFAFLEIDYVRFSPRSDPIRIYALLGDTILRTSTRFQSLEVAHERLFAAYRSQNWAEARSEARECRKLPGAIGTLYDLYEARIAHFEANPPGDHWDGAHKPQESY